MAKADCLIQAVTIVMIMPEAVEQTGFEDVMELLRAFLKVSTHVQVPLLLHTSVPRALKTVAYVPEKASIVHHFTSHSSSEVLFPCDFYLGIII